MNEQKTAQKITIGNHSFTGRGWEVQGGMIMITDSMCFNGFP